MKSDFSIPNPIWDPPYYFVIAKHPKWDNQQVKVLKITPDGGLAYAIYDYYQQYNTGSVREIVSNITLTDAFGKNALDFCKQAYDRDVQAGRDLRLAIDL
jgi:hypothetical protein